MKVAPARIRLIVKSLAALAALVIIMSWASGTLRSRTAPGVLPPDNGIPIPADGIIMTAEHENIAEYVTLSGTVHSERQISLSARLPAYVEAVYVNAGDRVPEGQLLIALDQRELREEQAAAQAALQQAETAFQRSERLLETNATTPQAHEAAELNVRAARAQAERVNVMLSYTRIQAPIAGIVSDRFVEAGDLAAMGQTLVTIFDPTRIRIEVPVPASLVHLFSVGTDIMVTLDQQAQPRPGTVTEIVSAFDAITRTRRVKIQLGDASADVLPGMYGQVLVSTGNTPALLLPQEAIERVGQLESIMVVHENRLQRRLVRTGATHQDNVRIISGLNAGEKVWLPQTHASSTKGARNDG